MRSLMCSSALPPASEASSVLMSLIALAVSAETPSAGRGQRVLSPVMVAGTRKRWGCFQTTRLCLLVFPSHEFQTGK